MIVKLKPVQSPDEPVISVNCQHWDTAYSDSPPFPPSPSFRLDITRLIESYKVGNENQKITPKTSNQAALKETYSGFRNQKPEHSSSKKKDKVVSSSL